MRKKEERFVVTFATTTGAMAMERACAWCGREDIPEEMEQAASLSVPLIAEAHSGKNWLAAKE